MGGKEMKILNVFKKDDNNEENFKEIDFDDYNRKANIFTVSKYKEVKKEVIDSLEDLINIYNEYGSYNERITELIEKLRSDNFQIIVLGEFSRGKSTFINALLNKNILPSNILPTTAVITKIFMVMNQK